MIKCQHCQANITITGGEVFLLVVECSECSGYTVAIRNFRGYKTAAVSQKEASDLHELAQETERWMAV